MHDTPPNDDLQPEITCRKCGNPYPPTAEYWYFQNGRMKKPCKECHKQVIRERQAYLRKTSKAKQPDPRQCRYCGKLFIPKSKHANRRQHCYQPDCIESAHRQYDPEKREYTRRWKAKNGHYKTKLKVCPLCGKKRMEAHLHFCCAACRIRAEKLGRCDGNYVYLPAMEEETWNAVMD